MLIPICLWSASISQPIYQSGSTSKYLNQAYKSLLNITPLFIKLSHICFHCQLLWVDLHSANILIVFFHDCVWFCLVTMPPHSLCRFRRCCRGAPWPSRLHCPLVDPAKERTQTVLSATLAPWKWCQSHGLIRFPRNFWPILQKGEGETCALSAPTSSGCQGQDLPTTLRGRRPRCECRLWKYLMGWNIEYIPQCVQPRCASQGSRISREKYKHVHRVHFLGYTWMDDPLDILGLTPHLHTFVAFFSFGVFVLSQFLPNLTWKSLRTKGGTLCEGASCHALRNCPVFIFLVLVSLMSLPVPPLLCPFHIFVNCLLKMFMYSMCSGQVWGNCIAQPFRCACVRVSAWICLFVECLYVTHLCLTGDHTAAGLEPKEVGRGRSGVLQSLTVTHTHQLKERNGEKYEEGCAVF